MFSFRLTVFALLTMFIDFYILETTSNLTIKIINKAIHAYNDYGLRSNR